MPRQMLLDVTIDKIINSIENSITGEVFDTKIRRLASKQSNIIKRTEWQFDWEKELADHTKEVYGLTTVQNPFVIQGLMCIENKRDHIFMHLIESAKFNKGKSKIYLGVPANLVAYACKISFEKGCDGYVAFDAKTNLIEHYHYMLGATHFRGKRMFIETTAAAKLVSQYFGEKYGNH